MYSIYMYRTVVRYWSHVGACLLYSNYIRRSVILPQLSSVLLGHRVRRNQRIEANALRSRVRRLVGPGPVVAHIAVVVGDVEVIIPDRLRVGGDEVEPLVRGARQLQLAQVLDERALELLAVAAAVLLPVAAVLQDAAGAGQLRVRRRHRVDDLARQVQVRAVAGRLVQLDGGSQDHALVIRVDRARRLAGGLVDAVDDEVVRGDDARVPEPVPASGGSVEVGLLLVGGHTVGQAGSQVDVEF